MSSSLGTDFEVDEHEGYLMSSSDLVAPDATLTIFEGKRQEAGKPTQIDSKEKG